MVTMGLRGRILGLRRRTRAESLILLPMGKFLVGDTRSSDPAMLSRDSARNDAPFRESLTNYPSRNRDGQNGAVKGTIPSFRILIYVYSLNRIDFTEPRTTRSFSLKRTVLPFFKISGTSSL